MRRALAFVIGIFVGQWLAFGAAPSPAEIHRRAMAAYEQRDYVGAMRLWSQAASLQPDNATFHYMRGTALAHLGLRLSAADAYQTTLFLDPPKDLARQVLDAMASLNKPAAPAQPADVVVPLEAGFGVWTTPVIVNGRHRGRFLVDTGSSVVVLSPAFAATIGLHASRSADAVELQTLGGRTSGSSATVASLKVGPAELQSVPVVLHDPGPGVDGILGNTFLSRYRVTVDADRRELHLRPIAD